MYRLRPSVVDAKRPVNERKPTAHYRGNDKYLGENIARKYYL
jgi:hypothetical protein